MQHNIYITIVSPELPSIFISNYHQNAHNKPWPLIALPHNWTRRSKLILSTKVYHIFPCIWPNFYKVKCPILLKRIHKNVHFIPHSVNKTIATWRNNAEALPCALFNPSKFDVGGAYAMWPTQRSACVQYLCDSLVNATAQYLDPDAKHTIPMYV